MENFNLLGDLGKGSFGIVKLFEESGTLLRYAIKCIRKESIKSNKQI